MKSFLELIKALEVTTSTLKKIDLISKYLLLVDMDSEVSISCLFLTGSIYPPISNKTLSVGSSLIKKAIVNVSGITHADFEKYYRSKGDLGNTAEEILSQHKPILKNKDFLLVNPNNPINEIKSLNDLLVIFDFIFSTRGNNDKVKIIENALYILSSDQISLFIKLLSGNMRIGVQSATVESAISKAFETDIKLVQKINFYIGDIGKTAIKCKSGDTAKFEFELFHPIYAMLASSEVEIEEIFKRFGLPIWCEYKYDGVRVHAHMKDDEVRLYTRDLKEITSQFPEVAKQILEISKKNNISSVLIDGEIIPFQDGKILPFANIQKRLGRKTGIDELSRSNPCSIICYDLLYIEREVLFDSPLKERRAKAEDKLKGLMFSELKFINNKTEFLDFFRTLKEEKLEGIMIKNPDSLYESGKRGINWIKYKQTLDPLDVVVTKGEFGNGKNSNLISLLTISVYNDKKTELLEIGRVYSGLSESQILELNNNFKEITIENNDKFSLFEPKIILEIAFENIQKSSRYNSGYAIRFPRVLKIRTDKPLSEINTISDVKRYFEFLS